MGDVVFHTSGSTGAAKEIVRTEESLQADARNLIECFPEIWGTDANGDSPLVVASVRPEHMYGALWRVRVPALAGVSVEPDTIVSVEQLVAKKGDGLNRLIFVTTPSFLEKAILHPDFATLRGSFRAIVISGSPLRHETALSVAEIVGTCPLEIYGSTETGTVAWRRQSEGEVCTLMPQVTASVNGEGRLVVDSPFAMVRPFTMGDLAERLDERHFLLKGRADRRVKILETFVSLAEVESALAAHPYVSQVRVEAYGEDIARLGALIVPTPAAREVIARDGSAVAAAAVRTALKGVLGPLSVPRRFRFVRELPTNEQGKTTANAARAMMSAWCREPAVLRWQATADELSAELVFPADMECFQGHFPEVPVLPGVAQLYFVRHFARQVFSNWPEAATYRRLKFQRIIVPFERIELRIVRTDDGFDFSLMGPNGPCSSGRVEATSP